MHAPLREKRDDHVGKVRMILGSGSRILALSRDALQDDLDRWLEGKRKSGVGSRSTCFLEPGAPTNAEKRPVAAHSAWG